MSYCDTCIHRDVCGVEGANDEATVYCADRIEPCDVFDEYGNYKYPSDVELPEPNTATSMPCEDEKEAVTDKNIYKVGDRVEVMSRSSRHNGKCGVIERVLYKVRFDDGSDSAFVESSLAKEEQDEI